MGHLRRCLSLAFGLRQSGCECRFLVNDDPDALALPQAAGFEALAGFDALRERLAQLRPELVVLDAYTVDPAGIEGVPLAVIDDVADRDLPVDLVINGAPGAERLAYRTRDDTRCLLGPQYALLRPEFDAPLAPDYGESVGRLLITLGGGDARGAAPHIGSWARRAMPDIPIDFVLGPFFGEDPPDGVTLHKTPEQMRPLMLAADLALCAGGQTALELAATGTPALAVEVAGNQSPQLEQLEAAGTLERVGAVVDTDLEQRLVDALGRWRDDPVRRRAAGEAGRRLVAGAGARRVAGRLVQWCNQRREQG